MTFESFVLSFVPFAAFELAMFGLIYILARAILQEEHSQEQREAEAQHQPEAPAQKLAA